MANGTLTCVGEVRLLLIARKELPPFVSQTREKQSKLITHSISSQSNGGYNYDLNNNLYFDDYVHRVLMYPTSLHLPKVGPTMHLKVTKLQ